MPNYGMINIQEVYHASMVFTWPVIEMPWTWYKNGAPWIIYDVELCWTILYCSQQVIVWLHMTNLFWSISYKGHGFQIMLTSIRQVWVSVSEIYVIQGYGGLQNTLYTAHSHGLVSTTQDLQGCKGHSESAYSMHTHTEDKLGGSGWPLYKDQ